MENVLQGIQNVIVYLDDILLSSATESDHLKLIDQVLDRLDLLCYPLYTNYYRKTLSGDGHQMRTTYFSFQRFAHIIFLTNSFQSKAQVNACM